MADGNGSNPTQLAVPSTIARLNYFYGQLLSQADLKAEQSYHVVLRRLVQRETFGVGTVAGLKVEAGPEAGTILVRAGLAMDSFGRELVLGADQCLGIVPAPLVPAGVTYFGSDPDTIATELQANFGQGITGVDVLNLRQRLIDTGMTEADLLTSLVVILGRVPLPVSPPVSLALGQTLAMYLFEALVGTTYVAAQYLERGADLAPALMDAGCCGDTNCHPTRIREGVTILTSVTPFAGAADPYQSAHEALSRCFLDADNTPDEVVPVVPTIHNCSGCLTDYVLGAWPGIPPTDQPCAPAVAPPVPMAAAYWSRYPRNPPAEGTLPPLLSVDNRSFRPLAPSPVVTRALLAVVTQCATPVFIPPTIVAIEPANGARLMVPPSGSAFVRARTTSPVAIFGSSEVPWQVVFYPASGGPVVTYGYAQGSPPPWITFSVDGGDPHVVVLEIADAAVNLAAGTYRWRLNPSEDPGDKHVAAEVTETPLDATPRPVTAVPSGNGKPGGTFEARFYISNS